MIFRTLAIWLALTTATFASSFTLPSTTTAYTAGQLMANSATGASVVVPSFVLQSFTTNEIVLSRGRLSINDTTAASWNAQTITIDLWSAAPTFANGDRSTYLPATGTANHLGALTCVMSAVYGDGLYAECSVATGNFISIPAAAPTTIYWTATATTGSGTTGASKVVTFNPEVLH